MVRFHKRYSKPGTPPGTLRPMEKPRAEEVKITILDYSPEKCEEREASSIEECSLYKDKPTLTWINVDSIQDVEMLQKLEQCFGFHLLTLEDVLNVGQRPKIENYDDYQFVVMPLLRFNEENNLESEQISVFSGRNYVITLQEAPGDVFDPIRERIRKNKGHIRRMGADYLTYALIDAIVDNYFPILETFGEQIEGLEDELVENPGQEILQKIHQLKRELLFLRKSAWPMREVINGMEREDSLLVQDETKPYLRDCYDHTIQIMDMIETYRDMVSGMLDIYLSSVSNKINQVMKVLTIIATIFMPLTFIVGIYGMNFNPEKSPWNMPELNWPWGYPAVLILMAAIGIIMLIYFRRKKWL